MVAFSVVGTPSHFRVLEGETASVRVGDAGWDHWCFIGILCFKFMPLMLKQNALGGEWP